MESSYFTHGSAAERYARGRPYFHTLVTRRIASCVGQADRALDVGCGTGMSSRALASLASSVIGVDPSVEMLNRASAHPQVNYIAAEAEALPFRPATFHLITVGLAFHWLNRGVFLSNAHRVLDNSGWLVVYNNWFTGHMQENTSFAHWLHIPANMNTDSGGT